MTDAQQTSTLSPKRPRGGEGTWARYYCDPNVSPKHAKGRVGGSPRTSPARAPRAQVLAFVVIEEIAALLAPYPRHHEPPHVVADVLLRLLPMPDCARSTVALIVHRRGTGSCEDLTYRRAGALGGYDRRTAIVHFARTEGYGAIRIEHRDHPWGGAAPNFVTATIPSWVYEQVDDYNAIPSILRPELPAAGAPVSARRAPPLDASSLHVETTNATPPERASATVAPALIAEPGMVASPSDSGSAVDSNRVSPALKTAEPFIPAPVLSPEDAAIHARLAQVHAFTRYRFEVTAIRGLNVQEPKVKRGGGAPSLSDAEILVALDEYIKNQRPIFERKARYGERLPDRDWVENGIHVFLWGRRQLLDGLVSPLPNRQRKRQPVAAPRRPRSSGAVNPAASTPVRLGAEFEQASTVVRSVSAGSVAARLLQPGDKVVRVDGNTIASLGDLRAVLAVMAPGLHTFDLVRSNEMVTATVTIEPRGPPES